MERGDKNPLYIHTMGFDNFQWRKEQEMIKKRELGLIKWYLLTIWWRIKYG